MEFPAIPPESDRGDRAGAIAGILQEAITSGRARPGDKLPSEAELCARFQVSRPTLREALGRLSANGMIASRRGAGGGSFIASPRPEVIGNRIAALVALLGADPDLPDGALTEARLRLEGDCAELAAVARADIGDLRAEIDRQSDFNLAPADFAASCQRMHMALAAASGNPLLGTLTQSLIEAEYARSEPHGWPTRERARMLSCHVRLANAVAAGRGDDARAALGDLADWHRQQVNAPATPQIERPPKMRDLRLPRVQRLEAQDEPRPQDTH